MSKNIMFEVYNILVEYYGSKARAAKDPAAKEYYSNKYWEYFIKGVEYL
jgi:hypothetical protein